MNEKNTIDERMRATDETAAKDGDNSFIEQLAELPMSAQRLTLIIAALNFPDEKRDELLAGFAEIIRKNASSIGREAANYAADMAIIADFMQKRQDERGEASEAEMRLQEYCDAAIALLMRDSFGLDRATRSESRELTCTACGAMHETKFFLRALKRDLELSEDDNERRDTLRYFAHHVHSLSEDLAHLIEKYPEAAEGIGGDYPNWPFLMFRRDNLPADYRRQADLIGLGGTCAVNPSPRVNWTALQKYLFTVFWEWQDAKRFMDCKPMKGDDRSEQERVKVCLADYPLRPKDSISDAEANLFLESFKLPPLTKTRESARQWAERFLVPLIDLREPDLEAASAFKVWLGGSNAKASDRQGMLAAIKEGVIRALDTMARDDQG